MKISPDYTKLYLQFRDTLLKYAVHCRMESSAAEDLVQQVFLKLLEKEPSQHIQNWKSYLFIMARNEIFNLYRREQLRRKYESYYIKHQTDISNTDILLEKVYQQRIYAAIIKLSPQQRLVYELRTRHNWTNKEVAAELDISPFTVKNHFQDAKRKIMDQLVA